MNYGKRVINDANDYKKPGRTRVNVRVGDELRTEVRPYGHSEKFVDPQGNVLNIQLYTPSTPRNANNRPDEVIRAQKIAEGWIEHGKCPLRHGTYRANAALSMEFAALPPELTDACISDPSTLVRQNGELHAREACPHVEWAINERRRREAEAAEKRNAGAIRNERSKAERDELAALELEMKREQIAEFQAKKKRGAK